VRPLGNVREACRFAWQFIRARRAAVVSLYLLTGALFVSLFLVYGLIDQRTGGWRGVIVGQAFIFGRILLRLTTAASEVRLVQSLGTSTYSESREPR
jgi:hypothetical protein